jgi:hypothetical protein
MRKPYPTELSYAQWNYIENLACPPPKDRDGSRKSRLVEAYATQGVSCSGPSVLGLLNQPVCSPTTCGS